MWTDSEDLAIISDMYQMKIKIITTKGSMDKNQTINWILPDQRLKKYAELKHGNLNYMVLLHENDSHFNLVLDKNSELAKLGSLSYRFNVGPIMENDDIIVVDQTDNEENEEDKGNSIKSNDKVSDLSYIKKELNKCKEDKKFVESEYLKCEQELRKKTEENEKLKIEVKDLKKQIISLERQSKNLNENYSTIIQHVNMMLIIRNTLV